MSYSEDNISAKSGDMEYSARSRKYDRQSEELTAASVSTRRRRNPASVPLPADGRAVQPEPDEENDAQTEHVPARRRARPADDKGYESDERMEQYDEQEDYVEEARPARRRSRRMDDEEQYDEQEDYVEEARPARRRSRRMDDEEQYDEQENYVEEARPARRRSRRMDDEEQYDEQEDYVEEARPARRRSRRMDDEEQYDEQEDYVEEARPARRKFGRRTDDEQYDARDDYPVEKPRNRFMAWLESLRIVEEIPEDEQQDEYEMEPAPRTQPRKSARSYRVREERGEHDLPAPAAVPVPAGRQRRAEIAEYSEDDEPSGSSSAYSAERHARRGEYRDDDAYTEDYAAKPVHEEKPINENVAENKEKPAEPAAESSDNAPKMSAVAADKPEQMNAEAGEDMSAADAENMETDVDAVPVRRRLRANTAEIASAKPPRAEAAPAPSAPSADETESLEQRYINASLDEKRNILFEHWREQFSANLVIPAKPEKLAAITDMVKQILDACSDEYALGERWEKIDALLGEYSSAVVAEYGYRKLLASVQAEEQQRMYARPSEDKQPRREQPQTPRLDEVKQTSQAAHTPAPQSMTEAENAEDESEYTRAPRKSDSWSRDAAQPKKREYAPEARARRQYSDTEFDYKPENERTGGIGRLFDKVKSLGRRGNAAEYDDEQGSAPVGSRIKQLFRKGDVLDYSSDDERADVDFGVEGTDEQYQRDTYRDGTRRNSDYALSQDIDRDSYDRSRTDARANDRWNAGYSSSVESYSRDSGNSYDDVKNAGGMAQSDSRSADAGGRDYYEYERQGDDGYLRPSDEREQTYDGYVRPERSGERADSYAYDSAYSGYERGGYDETPARADNYDYRDDATDARDYDYPSQDRSVYDESNEDYTPERPDYSHDYDDDDYRGGYAGGYASGNGYDRADTYR